MGSWGQEAQERAVNAPVANNKRLLVTLKRDARSRLSAERERLAMRLLGARKKR